MTINTPSIDPADFDSLAGTFKFIFKKLMQGVNGMLPAQVVSYDRASNRAKVQPLINLLTTGGEQITRASISQVPVINIGGGGFVLSFNLNPGDLGWIVAADRDISLFLQTLRAAKPNTDRMNDFADSFFLPHPMAGYSVSGTDAVLQSLDGAVKIALSNNKITITAPTVEINTDAANVNATAVNIESATCEITSPSVTITSTTGVNMTTPTLAVIGNITATGTITPGV